MRWLAALVALLPFQATAQPGVILIPGQAIEQAIGPGQDYRASLRLRRGESADVLVRQIGIDLAVDLVAPNRRVLATVDSPNGRNGDEPISIMAERDGTYTLRIHSLSMAEPAGRFSVRIAALRNRAETASILAAQRAARSEASAWLRARSTALPLGDSFDTLVGPVQVVGLGEATHGSRELNDVRLAMVRRLVERHNFRLIALEDSASRWRSLEAFVAGDAATPPTGSSLQWGWIGRRARYELLNWARQWNLAHPTDRVRIIGVDPQDSRAARERLTTFLASAYGPEFTEAWRPAATELNAADEQTPVFGNSDVAAPARARLLEVYARLETDQPFLARRFGADDVTDAAATVRELVQFADFNGRSGALARSRDWYMAVNLLAALRGPPTKAIYWGHNAHVSAAATSWGPTGALLRQALGCSYLALATTFREGAFVAQIPNDADDRLASTTLATGPDETVENVLAGAGGNAHLTAWGCAAGAPIPAWLAEPRPLRWIGGLYAPETPSDATYRPYRLTQAFDGIVYFPRVSAEDIPNDLPRIPARPREN